MTDFSKLSDEQLADIVRSQEKEVYSQIIKRYQAKLLRYAISILGDSDSGADVVQESFIKAYINLNSFRLNKSFSSWIYRIVHNEAMNVLKKQKHQQLIADEFQLSDDTNLEEDLIKKELADYAHSCLDQMPVIYREPLVLYYLEEKSYEEISDILRLPVGTVGTRLTRAKAIMKKLCQK